MKFNTRFDPPVVPGVVAKGGLTDQHQKDDCDLNLILKRYRAVDLPAAPAARYEDFTERPADLQDAFDRVQDAVEWFEGLPSDVRRRYDNDPRMAIGAALSGDLAELDVLFPNHSKAVETATPEPQKEAAVESPEKVSPPAA